MTTAWQMPAGSGDRWPEDYERGRPGWPSGAVTAADLPPSAAVLDLGAGTGKLTRLLTAVFARVVAVEPAEAMRRLLERSCPAEALPGDAHAIPLAAAAVDAVFAAQAFHWFEDEVALAEIARVLRPGGMLVVLWNLPAGPWEPSTVEAETLLSRHAPDPAVAGYDPLDLGEPGYAVDEPLLVANGFTSPRALVLPNPQALDREGLVSYYASMGWLADLPDDERLPLLSEVRSLLPAAAYRREWETHVNLARLRP